MRKSNLKILWLACALAWPVSQVVAETPAEEAARVIRQAQQSGREEDGSVSPANRASQLITEARTTRGRAEVDSADQARLDAAKSSMNAALGSASPEAKVLIAQSNSAPPMRAPSPDKLVPAESVSIADVASAKPEPMRATPLEPDKKKSDGETTTITAEGSAFFDSKESIGVFTDGVVVNDPQFHITCDVLEVFMKKDGAAGKPGAAPVVDPNAPRPLPGEGPKSSGFKDSGVDKAIAKGRKVVIQKVNETGQVQIGVCRHATYDGKTGDIILRDFPQVQDGSRTVTATERSTVMTLKQNGQFEAVGRYKTVLGKEEGAKPGSGSSSVSVPAPGAAPAPGN